MSAKTTGTVRFALNPISPPKLTPAQQKRLRSLPDEEINFTGIPPVGGFDWKRPGELVPAENKKQITLRLDEDVLKFFKTTGKRYQTRINEVLRSYMDAHVPRQRP